MVRYPPLWDNVLADTLCSLTHVVRRMDQRASETNSCRDGEEEYAKASPNTVRPSCADFDFCGVLTERSALGLAYPIHRAKPESETAAGGLTDGRTDGRLGCLSGRGRSRA